VPHRCNNIIGNTRGEDQSAQAKNIIELAGLKLLKDKSDNGKQTNEQADKIDLPVTTLS
jgi:hypothetical protein